MSAEQFYRTDTLAIARNSSRITTRASLHLRNIMASTTSAMNSPTSSKSLALRPRPGNPQPDTTMTESPGLCIFDLPLELRWEIYTVYLADLLITNPPHVHIEARKHRNNLDFRRAVNSAERPSLAKLLCTSRAVNGDVTGMPRDQLVAAHVMFFVDVKDLNFRLLTKFTTWLGSAENRFKSHMDLTLNGRIVGELIFNQAGGWEGAEVGRWLGSRRESSINIDYHVKEMKDPKETVKWVESLSCGFYESDGDLLSIDWAVRVHIDKLCD
ncbi:hypothetical protein LTR49_021093 [Elasticomyces elasticus]|nr:hypothetical protein LTR49_021093 [Elasticomyces elasticus]